MQNITYYDECKWREIDDGLSFEFVDGAGQRLAEVSLRDHDAKLWKFEVFVPARYQLDGATPTGVVFTAAAAKKVAEMILLGTIVVRS
ncbi:MAG: hypothetical protein JWL69_2655 [Phycisphaerales bacterium]|nr:hypothetical protein [Phycisphaerales bacterium]